METFNRFVELLQLRSWYVLAAMLITLSIQYIKKNPGVPLVKYVTGLASRVWKATPDGWRWVWPVLGGAVTAFVGAIDAGQPGPQALLAALGGAVTIGIGAMGLNGFLTELPVPWNGGAGGKPTEKPPSLPGLGAAVILLGASTLLLVAPSCQPTKDVVWPIAAKCSPAPAEVMSDVFAALKNDPGGSLSERALKLLEGLARKHGAAVIVCAANEIAGRLAADGDLESARVSNKALAFVEHTETRVEE